MLIGAGRYTRTVTPFQLQPGQAAFLFDYLLPQLQSEHAVTMRILAAVPAPHEDYRPHKDSRSTFELARHIVYTEIWFLDAILHHRFQDDDALLQDAPRTCAELAVWYSVNFASRVECLKALSAERLAMPVDWLGLRNDPAVTYLNISIRHAVHHRGQLSAYLRPMGASVPALYVESADETFSGDGQSAAAAGVPMF